MTHLTRAELVEAMALLPCPFCGGAATHPVIQGIQHKGLVWCNGCQAEMHEGKDGIPSAAENWNRRAHAILSEPGE